MNLEETNKLFLRYLKEVKGLDIKGEKMIYKIKFKRFGLKYQAEIKNVWNKKQAIEKLKQFAGNDIKIVKVTLVSKWQEIIIN